MPDDVTTGELDRRLRDHEARTDRIHGEQDSRITRVAAESVPLDVYQADQRAVADLARRLERDRVEDVRKLREDVINPALARIEALEKRPVPRPMTFGKWMALLGVVIAFIGVLLTAYSMSQGAK